VRLVHSRSFLGADPCAGLFYVIEGFLDIVLPDADSPKAHERARAQNASVNSLYEDDTFADSESDVGSVRPTLRSKAGSAAAGATLFTVKPGGIAGYLGELRPLPIIVLTKGRRGVVPFACSSFAVEHSVICRYCGENGHIRWVLAT
jgi:hypothetical protein